MHIYDGAGVGVWSAGVIDAQGRVSFRRAAVVAAGGSETDLPHGNPDIRILLARDVNLGGGREAVLRGSPFVKIQLPATVDAVAIPSCHFTPPLTLSSTLRLCVFA